MPRDLKWRILTINLISMPEYLSFRWREKKSIKKSQAEKVTILTKKKLTILHLWHANYSPFLNWIPNNNITHKCNKIEPIYLTTLLIAMPQNVWLRIHCLQTSKYVNKAMWVSQILRIKGQKSRKKQQLQINLWTTNHFNVSPSNKVIVFTFHFKNLSNLT